MSALGFSRGPFAWSVLQLATVLALAAPACSGDDDDEEGDSERSRVQGAPRGATDSKDAMKSAQSSTETPARGGGKSVSQDADMDSDESVEEGAGIDAEPIVVSLSETGHDRFYGVTHDASGNIYATGQFAEGIDAAADFSLVVAKFSPGGELDASFGKGGSAIENVAVGGAARENARGIVVQSSGKIVIAGLAEHDPSAEGVLAADTDIVLLRFDADGELDASFGEEGVVRLDLNTGVPGTDAMGMPTLLAADSQWALVLASDDRLIVHGAQRAEGFEEDGSTPREDSDWALLRLTADGELDASFGENGKVTLDIGGANASPRGVTLLADESIIATGYASSSALGEETQQPVLYKVTADGEFDATFATNDAWDAPGVWHDFAVKPPLRAECYGAALQGDHLVTVGYGPSPRGDGMTSDWVSFRFSGSGDRDLSYGTDGATYVDAAGYGDNGRFVLVLPDDRILAGGGGRPAPATPPAMGVQPPADAMLAVLTEDGLPDEDFAPGGFALWDLGGNDFFWAGALSPDHGHVAIAGIAGGATMGTDDDDAVLMVLPLEKESPKK